MKKSSSKASQVTRGIIEYLKKTNQLSILPQLVKETLKKSQTEKDPSKAIVTSPIALTADEIDTLTIMLSKQLSREIRVENSVNPEIIGGLKIQIGDKLIDHTLLSKLQNLGERLSQ